MWTVNKGSLQHTGDNIVALVKGLDKASEVDDLTVSPLCKPFLNIYVIKEFIIPRQKLTSMK